MAIIGRWPRAVFYDSKTTLFNWAGSWRGAATQLLEKHGAKVGEQEFVADSEGNGPVDASLKAIESQVRSGAELLLYSVNAITSGSTESQGEVTVRLQMGGRVVNGVGADPDIVVASAKAYVAALNKLHHGPERVAAQG